MSPATGDKVTAGLKLRAEDADDLSVIAACLQDALVQVGEMAYLRRKRRFVAAFNRVMWESEAAPGERLKRIRSGIHFDGVLAAKAQGLDQADQGQLLEVLTIACEQGEGSAATVTLVFAGGAQVRLEVECIDCTLGDMGAPWRARLRPRHRAAGEG